MACQFGSGCLLGGRGDVLRATLLSSLFLFLFIIVIVIMARS